MFVLIGHLSAMNHWRQRKGTLALALAVAAKHMGLLGQGKGILALAVAAKCMGLVGQGKGVLALERGGVVRVGGRLLVARA